MRGSETVEILRSIAQTWLGTTVLDDAPLTSQPDANWSQTLSRALQEELGVAVTAKEIECAGSLRQLSPLLNSRFARDSRGRSLVDVYVALEQFVREELSHGINYHWYADWRGDVFNNSDSLEDVEIVLRMEEAFEFSISDRDAQEMKTIGQTVRYLWERSRQSFTLRQRPENVCESVFVFHELRRLLMIRGGVPRAAVRLDARLGDLLPSWYRQFWHQVQSIFNVDLPKANPLTFSFRPEKRRTIKKLVALVASTKREQ